MLVSQKWTSLSDADEFILEIFHVYARAYLYGLLDSNKINLVSTK